MEKPLKKQKHGRKLNQFNEEYVNASFKKGKKHLHKSKKLKLESYSRNNARNRCIYTREKAQGKLEYTEDIKTMLQNEFKNNESKMIEDIDTDEELRLALEEFDNFQEGSDESNGSSNH